MVRRAATKQNTEVLAKDDPIPVGTKRVRATRIEVFDEPVTPAPLPSDDEEDHTAGAGGPDDDEPLELSELEDPINSDTVRSSLDQVIADLEEQNAEDVIIYVRR